MNLNVYNTIYDCVICYVIYAWCDHLEMGHIQNFRSGRKYVLFRTVTETLAAF